MAEIKEEKKKVDGFLVMKSWSSKSSIIFRIATLNTGCWMKASSIDFNDMNEILVVGSKRVLFTTVRSFCSSMLNSGRYIHLYIFKHPHL